VEAFLAGQLFRYFVFPLGSAVLGIAVKIATRNDQYSPFKKEDLAVGLDLIKTACLLFVVLTTERAFALQRANQAISETLAAAPIDTNQLARLQAQAADLSSSMSSAGWAVALFFLALWSVSTVVRKWGWQSEVEMHPLVGIAMPLAIGVFALGVVMSGALR
jgi:hypothetical protein